MHFSELDLQKVGWHIIKLAPLSHMLGHKRIKSTADDYLKPESEFPEARFVRDLFVLNVPEMIEKWFGGDEGAAEFIHQLQNSN